MTNNDKDMLILGFWASVVIIFLVFIHHDIPKTQTYYESHTVRQGETLSEIVELYKGSLIKSQAINSNVIMPGQRVQIVVVEEAWR